MIVDGLGKIPGIGNMHRTYHSILSAIGQGVLNSRIKGIRVNEGQTRISTRFEAE